MIYTVSEKAQTVIIYAETKSIIQTRRIFRRKFMKNPPSVNIIKKWYVQFIETGCIAHLKKPRNNDGLLNKLMSINEVLHDNDHKISIRKIAGILELSKSNVQRCLKILKLTPYKIQTYQKLYESDYEKRVMVCETLLDLLRNEPNSLLIMSDEATFHINGMCNKHNCRIWGSQKPFSFNEFQRDSPKVNVWCALSRRKIYGPFFFSEPTVTGTNYTDMLETFFIRNSSRWN